MPSGVDLLQQCIELCWGVITHGLTNICSTINITSAGYLALNNVAFYEGLLRGIRLLSYVSAMIIEANKMLEALSEGGSISKIVI